VADRRRAVLLAAQALALEEDDPEKALTLALEAHGLAPSLIPAAAVAGRLLAARGNTARAAKVIQKTWTKSPHPELATAYAYARIGDSPRDRLERAKHLFTLNPMSIESSIAVAVAAIEARDYAEARRILQPFTEQGLTRRVAALMARLEAEESGDKGRAREWLARAVTASRDAAWIADGVTSDRWAPISPTTGAIDAFVWQVPADDAEGGEERILGADLTEFIATGEPEAVIVKAEALTEAQGEAPATARNAAAAPAAAEAPQPRDDDPVTLVPEPVTQPVRPQRAIDRQATKAAEQAEPPKIFTPPRAPDDPGPDTDDDAPGLKAAGTLSRRG
jgi:HemY protein